MLMAQRAAGVRVAGVRVTAAAGMQRRKLMMRGTAEAVNAAAGLGHWAAKT
jgi:hypothetical protein